ncbi:MAG: hypothetical protein ABJB74_22535 [Gemmatimonas sp.]
MNKTMRTVLTYAVMTVGVIVGGTIVGAVVIAPAVSRAKPFMDRTFSNSNATQTEGTGGAVGQADGDPMTANSVAIVAPYKPMAQVIAATKAGGELALVPHRRTGFVAFKHDAAELADDALLAVGRVPRIAWLYADIGAVLLMAGIWFWRRRRPDESVLANAVSSKRLDKRSAALLPVKLVAGKGSRTPKAVAALAESGSSPADIARRTGLSLDAVAMVISMGSFGARQLQPPTA